MNAQTSSPLIEPCVLVYPHHASYYHERNKLAMRSCGCATGNAKDQKLIANVVGNYLVSLGFIYFINRNAFFFSETLSWACGTSSSIIIKNVINNNHRSG